jgi:hypothetical protein
MSCTTPARHRAAYRPGATPTGRPRIRFATAGVKHWAEAGTKYWAPHAGLKTPSPTADARRI